MDPRKRARILQKIATGRATRSERLLLKQEGLCFYCHLDLEKDVTKEHLDARANGGNSDRANLRVAHMRCNGLVGALSVELKLELHEIGRDQGAEAFWYKAREFQLKYGDRHVPYSRKGSGRYMPPEHPVLEEPRDLSPEDAELELEKLGIGSRKLSRLEKRNNYEAMARRMTDLDIAPMTYAEFTQYVDATYPRC